MSKEFIRQYHSILSPDFPSFLLPYLNVPSLSRLAGVGLLCGTDWTRLYNNRFFYSRLDHSVGVALIIWNFTHDKSQTIAGLLHDISSPAFSHVADFRNNDALHQESTESDNCSLLRSDSQLAELLRLDYLSLDTVDDYHQYPVADNKMPCLSADRLEYMYMTGLIMENIWSLEDIKKTYEDISVMKDESGCIELGFSTCHIAETYCKKCCDTGMIMIRNENKLALSFLAHIFSLAITEDILTEADFFLRSEQEIIFRLKHSNNETIQKMTNTFCNMNQIVRSEQPPADSFSVNLEVKRRYIDPLCNGKRLSSISPHIKKFIEEFLYFQDSPFGSVLIE